MLSPLKISVSLLFNLLLIFSAVAQQPGPDLPKLTGTAGERFDSIAHELRCLVCQNQTIGESSAPLAMDLKFQLVKMIQAGQTDAQIRQYMTERYGAFVLFKPPVQPSTWLLWFGPFGLLLLGFAVVWRIAHARTLPKPQAGHANPGNAANPSLVAPANALSSTDQQLNELLK